MKRMLVLMGIRDRTGCFLDSNSTITVGFRYMVAGGRLSLLHLIIQAVLPSAKPDLGVYYLTYLWGGAG